MDNNLHSSVLVAILGARRHYDVPIILEKEGILAAFYTDFYMPHSGYWSIIACILNKLPIGLFTRMVGRYDPRLQACKVHANHLLGLRYSFALRHINKKTTNEEIHGRFGAEFARKVSRSNWYNANIIYGCNTASLELFIKSKEFGKINILEQVSAPYKVMKEIYAEEVKRWGNWQELSLRNYSVLSEREQREWDIADKILCGSEFVVQGIKNCDGPINRCMVVPYSVDIEYFTPPIEKKRANDKLRILFVGAVEIRKGIQYLYEALNYLPPRIVDVKIAGSILLKNDAINKLRSRCDLLGLIPRSKIREWYHWADVLILPTVSEGSAGVTYEAMACGVPVITTTNAGSHVKDGETGFIVPIRDPEAIANRIEQLANDHYYLEQLSMAARRYALMNFSFNAYTRGLVNSFNITKNGVLL